MSQHKSSEELARALFERASGRVDAVMSNRLRLLRREALSAPNRAMRRLVPLLATASLLALALAWWQPRSVPLPVKQSEAVDSAWIESDEDSELYSWLGDAPVAPDTASGGAL